MWNSLNGLGSVNSTMIFLSLYSASVMLGALVVSCAFLSNVSVVR